MEKWSLFLPSVATRPGSSCLVQLLQVHAPRQGNLQLELVLVPGVSTSSVGSYFFPPGITFLFWVGWFEGSQESDEVGWGGSGKVVHSSWVLCFLSWSVLNPLVQIPSLFISYCSLSAWCLELLGDLCWIFKKMFCCTAWIFSQDINMAQHIINESFSVSSCLSSLASIKHTLFFPLSVTGNLRAGRDSLPIPFLCSSSTLQASPPITEETSQPPPNTRLFLGLC